MSNVRLRTENAALLGAMLAGRGAANAGELVLDLQRAARILHRNAERACNEDCGCRSCDGEGTVYTVNGVRVGWTDYRKAGETADYGSTRDARDCPACAGTGQTFGKREATMMDRLRAALEPYRLRLYEQGDPRGWPLYLIPEERVPEPERLGGYVYPGDGPNPDVTAPALRESLRSRWVASNYNLAGMAVCPH